MAWFAIVLVLLGNVVYHLALRSVPREANPAVATLAAYLIATVATAATLPALAKDVALIPAFRVLNWSTVVVGIAIVAIELGYLLAYRAGWTLSTASVTANVSLAVVLLGVGTVAFREPWSLSRVAGVGFCVLGLWLVNRK
jgi:drug/metabolite transporter (DMT)-like permease